MNKSYNSPEFLKLIQLLLPLTLKYKGREWTIDSWRAEKVKQTEQNRRLQDKIAIFHIFTSALLSGYRTRGESNEQRIELMNRYFRHFSDITDDKIQKMLEENKYPWKDKGKEIIKGARDIVKLPSFQWEEYFHKAESQYENPDYPDEFCKEIKNVGPKVRDLALSEFSNRFCAIDVHVADVIKRTGLLLHGYGQRNFGTSPAQNYAFLQRLIILFAKESGWSPNSSRGYSPKEIDRMFWFFGWGICNNKEPKCQNCAITNLCLDFKNRVE